MQNNDNLISPTWEVLDLVSHHLDPQSLAIASCVSKTWCTCFSSDHLWDPLCTTHFPSLSTVGAATLPRCRLYGLGYTAALRRQPKQPRKPRLALHRLLFVVSVRLPGGVVEVVSPCGEMRQDPHGLFRFNIEVAEEREWTAEELKAVKVTWTIVERGWKAVFTVAEDTGGNLSSAVDGFFSKELPSPGCCSSTMSSGLVADIRFGLKAQDDDSSRVSRIEKVSVGVMNALNWRHVSVDDGLLYLEHFLHV
ncbi:hypothetical protein RDABS01_014924 [Bienertia sinuspersici]